MTKTRKKLARTDSVESFFKDLVKVRFFGDIVKATYQPGEGRLVLVTGENATGKSFVRRVTKAALSEHEVELIALSMQFRTESGNIAKAFIYGDEGTDSTGSLSSGAVLGAIKTSHAREEKHAIFWDEPDVGLSDNYAAGAADEILEFVAKPPKKLFFAAVTTHRRVMLERLAAVKPHHVRLGDEKTLDEVLASPVEPKQLSELRDRNLTLFRAISKEFGL